jgi:hypothetical protein
LPDEGVLALLVLGHLVGRVLVALLAVGSHLLGNVDLCNKKVTTGPPKGI